VYENIVSDIEFLDHDLYAKVEDVLSEVWQRNFEIEYGFDDL